MKSDRQVLETNKSWKEALSQKKFVIQLAGVVAALLAILFYIPIFFHEIIGPRKGIIIHDVILNAFTPADYSWPIFLLIYASLFLVLQGILLKPYRILFALTCYLGINLLRMVTMYVLTLEPPAGMVLLHDPLIDNMAYGGNIFTKDLFFSGHVATLTLLVMVEQRKWVKWCIVLATIAVGILLMIQRVHYSIDVFFAPIATVLIVKLVERLKLTF